MPEKQYSLYVKMGPYSRLRYLPVFSRIKTAMRRPIVIIRDITRRKEAEQKLQRKIRERMRPPRISHDGVWTGTSRQEVRFSVPRCYTMLGYEDKEFPESFKSWQSLLTPMMCTGLQKQLLLRQLNISTHLMPHIPPPDVQSISSHGVLFSAVLLINDSVLCFRSFTVSACIPE